MMRMSQFKIRVIRDDRYNSLTNKSVGRADQQNSLTNKSVGRADQ